MIFPRQLLESSRSSDTINQIIYLYDTKINNLLFSDDLVFFYTVERGLIKKNIDIRTK